MKDTFRTIKKDHVYFLQMLDQLEEQSAGLESGEISDWSLVDHLVNTLCHYPVHNHHPMEDDFLELLKSRHWISDLIIDSLHRDHERLDQLGVRAQAHLSPVLRPGTTWKAKRALEVIAEFVKAYRDHIRTEEEVVFPMVEKLIEEQEHVHATLQRNSSIPGLNIH